MNIPSSLVQGDSAAWIDSPVRGTDGHIWTSASHTLSYLLAGPVAPVTLTATPEDSGWKTVLDLSTSTGLVPGDYAWQAVLTATDERFTVARGSLGIRPNLAYAEAGYDRRSVAEIALADAEAALANLSSSGARTKQYSIGGRSAQYYTAAELLVAISFWKIKVRNERAGQAIANGLGDPRTLYTRLG